MESKGNEKKSVAPQQQPAANEPPAVPLTESQLATRAAFMKIQQVEPSGMAMYFTMMDGVRAFHVGAQGRGVSHYQNIDAVCPVEVMAARWKLINEEVNNELKTTLDKCMEVGTVSLELKAKLLDDICYSIYVILGLAVNFGLPFDNGFETVHRANMKKLFHKDGTQFNEDGKVMKPEGWVKPDGDLFELVKRAYTQAYKMRYPKAQDAGSPPDENAIPESNIIVDKATTH